MANPNPNKSTQFKPGQSGNPSGRPKRAMEAEKLRQLQYADFIDLLNKVSAMTREQVAEWLREPARTMFELMFGTLVAQAAKGDKVAMAMLTERLFGKVKDVAEITTKNWDKEFDELPRENVLELLRKRVAGE